jgi:hypothetical protein
LLNILLHSVAKVTFIKFKSAYGKCSPESHSMAPEFGWVSPKGLCLKGLVSSPWCYWEAVETLRSRPSRLSVSDFGCALKGIEGPWPLPLLTLWLWGEWFYYATWSCHDVFFATDLKAMEPTRGTGTLKPWAQINFFSL